VEQKAFGATTSYPTFDAFGSSNCKCSERMLVFICNQHIRCSVFILRLTILHLWSSQGGEEAAQGLVCSMLAWSPREGTREYREYIAWSCWLIECWLPIVLYREIGNAESGGREADRQQAKRREICILRRLQRLIWTDVGKFKHEFWCI
jgi:hypothetical protein